MKDKVFFIAVFFNALLLFPYQERSTNGMKIIVVVDANSSKVSSIAPLGTFQKMMVSQVLENYPGCHFYMGNLKGNYDLIDLNLVPLENATISLYTERGFFRYEDYPGAENLVVGDNFDLGKVSAKVTSNKKGELNLKISSK